MNCYGFKSAEKGDYVQMHQLNNSFSLLNIIEKAMQYRVYDFRNKTEVMLKRGLTIQIKHSFQEHKVGDETMPFFSGQGKRAGPPVPPKKPGYGTEDHIVSQYIKVSKLIKYYIYNWQYKNNLSAILSIKGKMLMEVEMILWENSLTLQI